MSNMYPQSSFGYKPEFSATSVVGLSDFTAPDNGAEIEDGQVLTYSETKNQWQPKGVKNSTGSDAKTTDPKATNGANEGYTLGSIWMNSVNRRAWICVDDSPGLVIWARQEIK